MFPFTYIVGYATDSCLEAYPDFSCFEDSKLRINGSFRDKKLRIVPHEKILVNRFDPRPDATTFYEVNALPSVLAGPSNERLIFA